VAKREFTAAYEYTFNRSGAVRWIASHMLRYKHFVASWSITAVVAWVMAGSVSILIGNAFNAIIRPHPDIREVGEIALLIFGCVLVQGSLDMVARLSSEVLAQRTERDSRDELYLSLLGKSQTFHNQQRVGDIMARASNDVRQLNPMISPGFDIILDSCSGIAMVIIFTAFINPQLLIAPLLFVILFIFALRHYNAELNPISMSMREQFGAMNAGLEETIIGIEVVKGSAQEEQEKAKFARNARAFREYFIKNGQVQARYIPPLILAISFVIAFLHAIFLMTHGQISVGTVISYMSLMNMLRFPAGISIFSFNLAQMGIAGAGRILNIMREETELDENEQGYTSEMQGDIVFDHISFAYGMTPVLKDISFHAKPGQTVAIVGQTGAGKSTLAKLVNRTYDVTSGQVLVDHKEVRDWSLDSLRSQISTIEQDIFLFSRSIAENIAFGLGQQVEREAIEQAARDAQAHDFIMSFPDGYDTVIGERGVTLSGGQRQRLAIARALLTNPHILILDDSTSAIDSATEDEIQHAIRRVLEGRTTLLITHRLSQIRQADLILVLHQGELIDQGTHEELLQRCTIYQRIFARRTREADTLSILERTHA
jgi:ATP-binding cassette, subfamily B, bacterial